MGKYFKQFVVAVIALVTLGVPVLSIKAIATPLLLDYFPSNAVKDIGITTGPDGAMWFTEQRSNYIGRITTSGAISEYPLGDGSWPNNIITGPDGALWFTEVNPFANKIGRITTSGAVTEYPIPTGTQPYDITVGPDGAMWFTTTYGIGRITTSGIFTEYSLSLPNIDTRPYGITAGPDGALWFTESTSNVHGGEQDVSVIGRISTTGAITTYPLPALDTLPLYIKPGPDGALWFTEQLGDTIGRITTSGVISEYAVPTADANPYAIITGPDGALWFTEQGSNNLGRITTPGVITEYPLPDYYGYNITPGPDGALWIGTTFKLGRFVLSDTASPSINYTASPAANSSNWNNNNVTVTFNCSDNIMVASCSSAATLASEGANQAVIGTATDEAGNTTSITTGSINIDKIAPTTSAATMSATLILLSANETISATAADSLSGVAGGEYYIDTDPGQGNGHPMSYAGGTITTTATIGSGLSLGTHTLYARSQDKAGNWSTVASKTFTYL